MGKKLKGIPKKSVSSIDDFKSKIDYEKLGNFKPFEEGKKVKLNLTKMKDQPDFDGLTDKYKAWIENNKDKTFTVEFEDETKKNSLLCSLKEDESVPKWLFWYGDLIPIDEV